MAEKKFKRDGQHLQNGRGRVVVRVFLANSKAKGAYVEVRSNIVKRLVVADAKVSEVFDAIEKALFDQS